MAFTGQLGTAQSQLGNIELGTVASSPPPVPQPVLTFRPVISFGPPIRGVPWLLFQPVRLAQNRPLPGATTVGSGQFAPLLRYSPPILGVPWRWILPRPVLTSQQSVAPVPAPPRFAPLGLVGGPLLGVPFLAPFMFAQTRNMNIPVPLPAPVGSSSYVPSQQPGVPIRGVPWNLPVGLAGRTPPVSPPPPPVPPPPPPPNVVPGRPVSAKPLVIRDPAADERTRRHMDQVAEIFNSLVQSGILQKTAIGSYVIRAGGYVNSRPPGPHDDLTIGVVPGVQWVDTTAGTVWFNVRNSVGSAIWKGPF